MEEIVSFKLKELVKGNSVESMKKFYGKHNVGKILEVIFACGAFQQGL